MGTAVITFCYSSLTVQLVDFFSLRQRSRRSCQVRILQRPRRQLWQLSNHDHQLQSIPIGNIIWLHQLSVLFLVLLRLVSRSIVTAPILLFPCRLFGQLITNLKFENQNSSWLAQNGCHAVIKYRKNSWQFQWNIFLFMQKGCDNRKER